MSLQGNLEMFPVDEVLRMLVRSTRAATLRIETAAAIGSIHVSGGSVLSAEFDPVIGLTDALRARGLISPEDAATLEDGRRTVLDVVGEDREAEARRLIAERSVEALHRIGEAHGGTFSVEVDRSPQVVSGFTFDLGELTDLASLRSEEWSNALAVLGDRTATFGLCGPPPGDDDIVLSAASWRIVCALGRSTTIRSAAALLGASEFEVARELARLVQAGLAEQVSAGRRTESHETPTAEITEPSQAGWWQEPEGSETSDVTESGPDPDEPRPSQDGWWEEPDSSGSSDDETAGDGAPEPEGEEADTGLGLGRRSMGAFRRVLDA